MTSPCPQRRDQIADYVLGALDDRQAQAVREHLASCDGCRRYAQSLGAEAQSLVALGWQVGADVEVRQNKVIEALQKMPPAQGNRTRVLPLLGGYLRTAVAAVLVLGAGLGLGRWTAPRVNVEQLRADLQASITASIAGAVQKNILHEVDQRWQAGLSGHEAKLRTELTNQIRNGWQYFATEAASNAQNLVEKRFAELVQIVEEARLTDRQRMVKALERMEQNRYRDKAEVQTRLAALIEKKPATLPQ